jgi:NTE family protein
MNMHRIGEHTALASVLPFRSRRNAQPRIGLVLGGGGVLGAAWMAGALVALQKLVPCELGAVDLVVGTSAGSILAAALRCRVDVEEIVEHQRGATLAGLPSLAELDRDSEAPPPPRIRIGSPRLLASAVLAPHRIHPLVAASALAPQGRGQHRSLTTLVYAFLARDTATRLASSPTWPARGETWIIAVDYGSGRRTAFGRPGAPVVPLPDAVVASCSIPGWYEPKSIYGRRYIDGGARSSTSLDLLARLDLDEVYVLAPMASYHTSSAHGGVAHLDRLVRRMITAGLTREVRTVRDMGTRVTVLTPGPEDLAAIGVNMMDSTRRQLVLDTSLRTSHVALLGRASTRLAA